MMDRPRITILRKRNVVFVVDDDLGMLKGLERLLRHHGYDSVLFSSAEEFQNHDDFEFGMLRGSRHQPEQRIWNRTAASSQGGGHFPASYLHHRQ